jgi:hypothetical protein
MTKFMINFFLELRITLINRNGGSKSHTAPWIRFPPIYGRRPQQRANGQKTRLLWPIIEYFLTK